ncbi:MAG TPA: nuclear transport factor 2 family protein [Actinomycetota bacterium]|jgi:ketosteroid isomerase-like protein|nr:nuclear transport factor 2 family protein [Actinomycetota bacterium]
MADRDAGAIAEQLWERLGAGDWDAARRLLHDDFVQEWPQSGERIEGADDALAIDRNFPGGLPSMRFRRTSGADDLAVLEVELEYADGSRYQAVAIVQIRDGKVVKETDYFAQPFDPPQWRAQWVRRMPR